jgi:tRNA (guanine37-N1)-methyltransferase
MKISVGTLFPQLYAPFLTSSIIGRAIEKNILSIELKNLFDYVLPKERLDSPIVGHGEGMVIGAPIIEKLYDSVSQEGAKPFVIFFSPHGKQLNQDLLKEIYQKITISSSPLLLVAGRYEGIDARAEEFYADEILSIGDYVVCGGDLPAMVFLEGLLRLKEGVVGKKSSVENDSFYDLFLDSPHYSDPDVWKNYKVPPVLKSGDHKKIADWRLAKSLKRSILTAWRWVSQRVKKKEDKQAIKKVIPKHYCVLLHNDVMLPNDLSGESSVTSIDIHDIARTSATYGIEKFFVVTRLKAQQEIVNKFLHFWHDEEKNRKVNESRSFALKNVSLLPELDSVIAEVFEKEGVMPITVVTSSRRHILHEKMITFHDQGYVWGLERPVIFVFGTAHGICPEVIARCDFRIIPIEGLEEFNFLSVRAAAAVVIDRWLGCNTIVKI